MSDEPKAALMIDESGLTFQFETPDGQEDGIKLDVWDMVKNPTTALAWANILLLKDLSERQSQLVGVLAQLAQVLGAVQQRAATTPTLNAEELIDRIMTQAQTLMAKHGRQ